MSVIERARKSDRASKKESERFGRESKKETGEIGEREKRERERRKSKSFQVRLSDIRMHVYVHPSSSFVFVFAPRHYTTIPNTKHDRPTQPRCTHTHSNGTEKGRKRERTRKEMAQTKIRQHGGDGSDNGSNRGGGGGKRWWW